MIKALGGLAAGLLAVAAVFYLMPHATHTPRPVAAAQPVALASLPVASCEGQSHLTIVAHEDDDVLFMNPDIGHSIQAGECNWTIYLTAGDAGQGPAHWRSREQGAEAAYAAMSGSQEPWVRRAVRLSERQVVTMAGPRDNSRLGLLFMRLPDGNTDGGGFAATHHESLERLAKGDGAVLHAVDGASAYTAAELAAALQQLLAHFAPTEIRTQAAPTASGPADHSDHLAVGQLVRQAYEADHPSPAVALKFYRGYEVAALPANVTGADLAAKRAAFLAYARFDRDICPSAAGCLVVPPPYGNYILRQYVTDR